VLTADGTTEQRLARTNRVTWWSIYLDGEESAPDKRLAQRVTVMDKSRWTEGRDFSAEPYGRSSTSLDGYFRGKTETQCYVLEPPIGADALYVLPNAGENGYRHPVLLVHGINGTASEWVMDSDTSIPNYLRKRGFPVWELHYGMGQENLGDSAAMLYSAVQQVRAAHPKPDDTLLDVVTHGFGGVVLRKTLQTQSDMARQLGRILMIGPPHHGSYKASLIRGYRDTPWTTLRERMGLTTDYYKDPLAPIYTDLTPGSDALLQLEQGPEAFRDFKDWSTGKAALVLAGNKPTVEADVADPENQEAPLHSDGVVSMSSASLWDQNINIATIDLNHKEQVSSESSARAMAAFLGNPYDIVNAPDVDAGGILTSANCGLTARGGLVVDLRKYSRCGESGVSGVKWVNGSASSVQAEDLLPTGIGTFFYYSRLRDAQVIYPGLAMAIGQDKAAKAEGSLRISCRSTGVFLNPVTVLGCRTTTVVPEGTAFQLTLQKTGSGTVTSNPTGLNCDAGCSSASYDFPPGRVVLTASPAASFLGWAGACSGTAPSCTLTMDADKSVTARFGAPIVLSEFRLSASSVTSAGTVTGTVTLSAAAPAGGTVVTLTSDNTAVATVPASVTVAASQTSAQFTVTARTVTSPRTALITARLGGDAKTATLTVTAPLLGPFNMQFVTIPAGEFMMGCSPGDSECAPSESPRHPVQITKSFEMGQYEVTQEQWQAVQGSPPSFFKGGTLPIEQILWNPVQQFLTRLNGRNDGYRYRLPTEAEWEYAARAGSTDKYAGGVLNEIAWYSGNSSSKTHPVGEKKPNAWGLHDMLGNVEEWCQDWYGSDYYSQSPVTDPPGASSGDYKVLRGGSWAHNSMYVRVSSRVGGHPMGRSSRYGFRCVREKMIP
jgi:formylglycine-generating enzyme required for sulfatase activity/pimeloyl-ACP methyl ester carboxylesterase